MCRSWRDSLLLQTRGAAAAAETDRTRVARHGVLRAQHARLGAAAEANAACIGDLARGFAGNVLFLLARHKSLLDGMGCLVGVWSAPLCGARMHGACSVAGSSSWQGWERMKGFARRAARGGLRRCIAQHVGRAGARPNRTVPAAGRIQAFRMECVRKRTASTRILSDLCLHARAPSPGSPIVPG